MRFRLKTQSIQTKIIISSLVITLIPLLILEVLFLYLNQQRELEAILDSSAVYADNLEDRYKTEINKLERLASTLKDFTPLDTYLSSTYDTGSDAFYYYVDNVHPMLESCSEVYDNIIVRVYHDESSIPNYAFYINNEWSHFVEQLFPGDQIQQPAAGWVKSSLQYYTFQSTYSYYLAVQSKSNPYDNLYGVSVHADEAFFYEPISTETQEGGLILVMDQDGYVLSASDRKLAGSTLEELELSSPQPIRQMADRQLITLGGVEYYLFQRDTSDLHILYLVGRSRSGTSHGNTAFILVVSGGLLILLAASLLVRVIRIFTGNISILKEKMTNLDRERIRTLAVDDTKEVGGDEIEQLDAMFTRMMGEINLLIERTQQQEARLKDAVIMRQQAEIQALQHQIDPHYLFNTLETIRMKLIMKHDRENAEIVKLFAESFRRHVDIRDEFVPMFEEVAFAQKYIRIQNYRLNDKIHFTCVAKESMLHYNVPKLMLQPLVENAVRHGVEPKEDIGEIILRMEKTKTTLEIFVEDNGVGMNPEELNQLNCHIYSRQPGRSVGLQNICQRIRLTYGEQAKMNIESIEGVGTAIQITLPLDTLEEN